MEKERIELNKLFFQGASKMKQVLVIGAGRFQISGLLKLKEKGFYVIGIDGDENCEGKKYCNEFYNIDIKDYHKIIQLIEQKNFNLFGCISFSSEYALKTVAVINETLGLNGLTLNNVKIATSKLEQRKILEKECLPTPKYFSFCSKNNAENIEDMILNNKLSFPCIVKPIDSAGSRGVSIVKEKNSLKKAIKVASKYSSFENKIIVEEFIEGIEFTVESLIINEDIRTLAISEKKKPLNNFTVSIELFYNSPLVKELKSRIEKTVNQFLKACNFNNTITHTEVIYSYKYEEVYIIETTTRSGGFGVFDKVIPLVTGIDIVGTVIDLYFGKSITINNVQENPCILRFFTANEGELKKIVQMDKIIDKLTNIEYGFFVNVGDNIGPITSDGSRLGYIISYGDNWEEVFNNANLLEYSIRFEVLNS